MFVPEAVGEGELGRGGDMGAGRGCLVYDEGVESLEIALLGTGEGGAEACKLHEKVGVGEDAMGCPEKALEGCGVRHEGVALVQGAQGDGESLDFGVGSGQVGDEEFKMGKAAVGVG